MTNSNRQGYFFVIHPIYLDRNPPKGSIRVATLGGRATYDVIYDYH